jgi:hypothetical protein
MEKRFQLVIDILSDLRLGEQYYFDVYVKVRRLTAVRLHCIEIMEIKNLDKTYQI